MEKTIYDYSYYLANALEWIRGNEPDDLIFAEVLFNSIGMTLEDTLDYLAAFGVGPEDRREIEEALLENYGGK